MSVTTDAITVNNSNVIALGTIIDAGKGNITAYGHCWATTTDPTISDNKTSLGAATQTGAFSSMLTNLSAGTYFVRAYVTDGSIVKYGETKNFTSPVFPCGQLLLDIRNGKSYKTVLIGSQCWMADNLNLGGMINSLSASDNQANNPFTEKYCYGNDSTFCNNDGALYQWDEAMQYTAQEGAQGLCPAGWHIPAENEWKTLETALGMTASSTDSIGFRGTDQGSQLRISGTSGFDALLNGFRNADGGFYNNSLYSYYWTSTDSSSYAWCRGFSSKEDRVYRNTVNKMYGFSVRCVKD